MIYLFTFGPMKKKPIREIVLRTASRLFYQQGYSNTGINQIVEEAGIAKSSLYQHFRTKEDLLMAYLEDTGAQTTAALRKAADRHEQPRDRMLAIFNYLEELLKQPEFYGCRFLNIVYEMPHDNDRVRERIKVQKDTVRQLFTEILTPIQKEHLADEFYTLFEGALIGNKVHNAHWPIVSATNTLKRLL
ncbi:TetR family transcriptional regulator [Chitinophaga sp. S165]|nr:TetR family transcriptional regulator [Chitinophaga sp. S165]